jgi:hypothetical protein
MEWTTCPASGGGLDAEPVDGEFEILFENQPARCFVHGRSGNG